MCAQAEADYVRFWVDVGRENLVNQLQKDRDLKRQDHDVWQLGLDGVLICQPVSALFMMDLRLRNLGIKLSRPLQYHFTCLPTSLVLTAART